MTQIRFISGQAALRNFIEQVREDVDRQLDERNINASGALSRSHRIDVGVSGNATTGELLGLSYWTTAGSGSPPGTVANLDGLKAWLLDKGIVKGVDNPSWLAELIQDKIYAEGSKRFRERQPNVYRKLAREKSIEVSEVIKAFLTDIAKPMDSVFTAAFKVA